MSLVGRYLLEDRYCAVDEPARARSCGNPGHASRRWGRAGSLVPLLVDAYALDAETEPTMWFTVSLYRSALQVIVDDYASTPCPRLTRTSSTRSMTRSAVRPWQFPIAPDQIPCGATTGGGRCRAGRPQRSSGWTSTASAACPAPAMTADVAAAGLGRAADRYVEHRVGSPVRRGRPRLARRRVLPADLDASGHHGRVGPGPHRAFETTDAGWLLWKGDESSRWF